MYEFPHYHDSKFIKSTCLIHNLVLSLIDLLIKVSFDQVVLWHMSDSPIQSSDQKPLDHLV